MNDRNDVDSAYDFVRDFAARTGVDNSNGRISKNFFPSSGPAADRAAPSVVTLSGWSAAKANNAAVTFEVLDAHAFVVDTTNADETRHANFEYAIKRIPEGACFVAISFSVTITAVTRTWPKLVSLVRFVPPEGTILADKETVATTRTLEETSEHRVCFQIPAGETSGVVGLHVPKDSGVRLVFRDVDVTFLDDAGEALVQPDDARMAHADNEQARRYMLPGTTDLTPIRGQKIDMIAGCETSYISFYMKQLGFQTFHSFEHHRAMDPYTELMSGQSPYMTSDAEIVVLSQVQVLRPLITRIERAGGTIDRKDMQSWVDATIDALRWSIEELRRRRDCKIWIFTHPGYHTPAMGVFEYRSGADGWSVYEMLNHYKMSAYALSRRFSDVFVLDVDLALERLGKLHSDKPRIRQHESLGGHLENDGAQIVGEHFIHQLLSVSKKLKKIKCAVVDCDNTLWQGILRDDGEEKIKLHRTRFQRLWHLAQRGIPIALCSKNDHDDTEHIMNIIGKYGALKNAIVTTRINWLPKSQNIQSIADELNINVDTVALFDDNPFEREEVKAALPEVTVMTDSDILVAPELPIFQLSGDLTAESVSRVERYKEDTNRIQEQDSFGSDRFEVFLMQCQMRLETRLSQATEYARVAEMFQRTNQMNATMKRADLAQVEKTGTAENGAVHVVKLGDKFGDYGIIGASLSRIVDQKLKVEEFALSCRAMGRRVEDALLEELLGYGRDNGLSAVEIQATKTTRNDQIIETLQRVGFVEQTGDDSTNSTWTLDLKTTNRQGRNFARWFKHDANIQKDID